MDKKKRVFVNYICMNPPIRSYKETDRDAILEIARVTWNGHDHLNQELDSLVKNPACNPFVLEEDGKVIAFANLRIIEKGKTGWMETLRIHPDFREKGYGHIMTDFLVEFAKKKGISRLRLTQAGENEAARKLAESIGMIRVLTKSNLWCGPVSEIDWRFQEGDIKEISGSDAYYLLQGNPELIPKGIIIYYWYALDATLSGLKEIGEQFRIWGMRKKNRLVGLSFGKKRETTTEIEWATSIYAEDEETFSALLSKMLDICVSQNIEAILVQHNPKFENLHESITWLNSPFHKIELNLYERIL